MEQRDKILEEYYAQMGIAKPVYDFCMKVEEELKDRFLSIDKTAECNQMKVLRAMQKNHLSEACFAPTTGYGYNDIGRETLEKIYADVFGTEDALVRPQITCGTHALALALMSQLRPGDELLSPVGKPYDTLEEVIGIRPSNGSLAEYLKRNGAVRESEALHYIYQLADALKFIHQHQMNHLDIKPGNVLLDNNNNATLIDFGLSKRYDGEGHQTSTTPIGISAGYAPMEQYKQGGVSTFSPATDIYSLGATLYKLLTNETPPDASDVNDDGLPPLPPSISQSTADTIEKAMQPRRRDRPQSIDEFLSLLTNNNKPSMQYNEEESETTIIPSISPKAEEEPGSPNIPPKRANHLSNREIWFIAILILLVTSIFVINKTSYNVPAQDSDTAVAIENPIPNLPAQPIDLGLSVKWASWNVGASSPEDYGGLYGWADPTGNNTSTNNTDYPNNNPPSNICGTNYDIAHIKWGENWRLPTKNEVLELCEKCSWKWTSYKGSNGYMITGPSGNYIFLPAVGQRYGTNIGSQKNFGYYWSGTLYSTGYSNYLSFSNTQYQLSFTLRYLGCSVRPVSK